MGWFDNDKQKERPEAPARSDQRREEPAPAPPPREGRPATVPGSTLGERVQVNGTIVSHEDLTVVGRIEGTVRAAQTLRIAEGAEVEAVIHGRRVLVQGTVIGDIHGAETVVLGPTAAVTGNIRTPSLEIHDGGFFKGQVDMKSARKAAAEEAERQRRTKAEAAAAERRAKAAAEQEDDERDEEDASAETSGPEASEEGTGADAEGSGAGDSGDAEEAEGDGRAEAPGRSGPAETARST